MLAVLLTCAMLATPKETQLSFKTTDGLELHGTFLEPEHPAGTKLISVLLLPGSGPTDRDGNQPPALITDLLKQIASALADKGIASYRFDKRAAHSNAAIWPKDTDKFDDFFAFEHFRDDAISAFNAMKGQPSVDPARCGMLGHSEGGLITITVAAKLGKDQLPAIALLGTAGRSLDLVILDQISGLLHRQTTDDSVIKTYMDALQKGIDYVKANGKRPTDMPAGLQGLFTPGTGKILQSYFTIDPAKTIHGYTGDVLLMQGEMDSQISVTKDFPLLKTALSSRSTGSLTTFTVPNASHNLKPVDAITDPGIDGPVEPAALGQILKWASKL